MLLKQAAGSNRWQAATGRCRQIRTVLLYEKREFPDKKAKLTGIQKLSASRVGKVLSES
jgi:hypothetical protein